MMQTKFIIKMKIETRPDLDYFYCGEGKSGHIFDYRKARALRYTFKEEALRAMSILAAMESTHTYEVVEIKTRK